MIPNAKNLLQDLLVEAHLQEWLFFDLIRDFCLAVGISYDKNDYLVLHAGQRLLTSAHIGRAVEGIIDNKSDDCFRESSPSVRNFFQEWRQTENIAKFSARSPNPSSTKHDPNLDL